MIPPALGISQDRDILWEDVTHVITGKEQKVRFAQTLFDWLAAS